MGIFVNAGGLQWRYVNGIFRNKEGREEVSRVPWLLELIMPHGLSEKTNAGGLQWRYVNGIFRNKEGSSTEVFVSGVFVKEVFVQ